MSRSTHHVFEYLVPQLALLFKVMGPLECGALLEEACRWVQALRTLGLLHLLTLLPVCD